MSMIRMTSRDMITCNFLKLLWARWKSLPNS